METGRHFVSYIAVAALILVYEYTDARPTTDSLYGDYLYSGAIYPISGAVPKKIHSHDKSHRHHTKEIKAQSNTNPTMNSLYGNTQPMKDSMKAKEIKTQSSTRPTMDSMNGNAHSKDSMNGNAHSTMDSLYGSALSTMDSLYGNADSNKDSLNDNAHSKIDSMNGHAHSKKDSMKGKSHSTMDSLYGDHVYSGVIHAISGAIPKKLPRKNKTKEERKAQKAKKIFDNMGTDLSQIDLNQVDAAHKFDGKDSYSVQGRVRPHHPHISKASSAHGFSRSETSMKL